MADGDIVRVFSARGAFLACAQGRPLCAHGNPNAVTRDVGTSSLAQGCTDQLTAVQLERFDEPPPPVHAFEPPAGQPAF